MKECGNFRVPVLRCAASPRSQQTQADLPAGVKVGVESDFAVACRGQVDLGGTVGVIVVKVDIE